MHRPGDTRSMTPTLQGWPLMTDQRRKGALALSPPGCQSDFCWRYLPMASQVTLEELEQQTAQLPPHEQLKLVALISGRLSLATQPMPAAAGDEEYLRQQREREANELLALCDTAAELWE